MDETEIAATLAAKLEEAERPETPEPAQPEIPRVPEKQDEAFHDNLPLEDVMGKMQIMDFFEIPQATRRTAEVNDQINRIISWAKDEAKSSDVTEMMRVIREQETMMGSRLKEQRVYKLYQYVKIHEIRKQLAEKERALYG